MSTTTTQKNSNFQSTPLQDVVALTDVPGVGPKSKEKLEEANIKTPVQLMGQFMVICGGAAVRHGADPATDAPARSCAQFVPGRAHPAAVRCAV
jgi:hypothetical protein